MFLLVSVCCDTAQALVFLCLCQYVVTQPKPWCSCWFSVLWHSPGLGVLAGVSVLWHSPRLGVLAGVSVLWHSPGLGVLAGVSVLWQPRLWCSCWFSVLWHSPGLGVLAGVSVLWHSPSLGVLACWCQCVMTQPKPWCSCWCQCVVTQPKPSCKFFLCSRHLSSGISL